MDLSDTEADQNIIYITEEEYRSEWFHDATKALLKIYDEHGDMLDSGIISTHRKLWELTSNSMKKQGHDYTAAQCENKWKALKRAYRNKLKRIHRFGPTKTPCPFECEVAEILNKRLNARSYSIKIDKLKRQEDLFKINLNEISGIPNDKTTDSNYINEKHIVILKEKDIDNPDLELEDDEVTYTVIQDNTQRVLIEEIGELKHILVKHNKINTGISKELVEVHKKILNCLESVAEGQAEAHRIEEMKAKRQDGILHQLKLQNELMQKLLEKIS